MPFVPMRAPHGGTADIPDAAVPHKLEQGWVRLEDDPPPKSASKDAWVEHAEQLGDDRADDKTVAELQDEFGN